MPRELTSCCCVPRRPLAAQASAQPDKGTYIHGLYIEGARWDVEAGSILPSKPKELHSLMPVIHIRCVTTRDQRSLAMYQCPVYTTKVRGPTYQFTALLATSAATVTWVLAGVCLLMQAE
jgi:dynein heavy chain